MAQQPEPVELVLEATTDRFDPDDERWQRQVAQLRGELARDVGGVRLERTPVAGTKGGVQGIIMALGSAGAITAAVEVFRTWLSLSRDRSLRVRWTGDDGREQTVSLSGSSVDDEAMQNLTRAIAARIGGPSWQQVGTDPS